MNNGFTMKGMEGISAMLARLEESELRGAAYTGAQAGLEAICMEARMLCPKDTGALADSIAVRMTDDGGEVYAGAPYAVQVEMGTGERRAQPFLFPAMRAKEGEALRCVSEALSRQMKGNT